MPQRTFKPVFERSLKELDRLAPIIEKVKAANLEKGLYNSNRDQRYTSKDLFIHEYWDRKELTGSTLQPAKTHWSACFKNENAPLTIIILQ